jgi:hypothetical protein
MSDEFPDKFGFPIPNTLMIWLKNDSMEVDIPFSQLVYCTIASVAFPDEDPVTGTIFERLVKLPRRSSDAGTAAKISSGIRRKIPSILIPPRVLTASHMPDRFIMSASVLDPGR